MMAVTHMIHVELNKMQMKFKTSDEVFSPMSIDKGTMAMLTLADIKSHDKVLDLGCGYGVVGIYASKIVEPQNVVMIDKDVEAIRLAKENAILNEVEGVQIIQSEGFRNLNEKGFTIILSNPPYHEDFSVPKEFIEKGFNRLHVGGRIMMVTKRRKWYKNKLTSIFGGCKIFEVGGYYVFRAEKRSGKYANAK